MNMKAHALLTEHYASARGLPRAIRESLPRELREKPRLYPRDLGDELVEELADQFHDALEPLYRTGRLGIVLFQFPMWFPIGRENKAKLRRIRDTFRPYRVAVELRNRTWMSEDNLDETLGFFARNDLIYTCVDEPQGFVSSVPAVAAATSDVAYVRMHGRNAARWESKGRSAANRFEYRYSHAELVEWTPKVLALADHTREVHVVFGNGPLDNAVANAHELAELVELAGHDAAARARIGHGARSSPSRNAR
jgi:uncharacterized protein YecE (DUF72 family)